MCIKKNIKLFVNNNEESIKCADIVKKKFRENGFRVVDNDNYEIAIAIGGDGSFIRMLKANNFREDLYYVGINAGHLGFLQEVKINDIDKFIKELINDEFQIEELGVQETKVYLDNKEYTHYSSNEILVRDDNLDLVKSKVMIDNDLLENFTGDGILISTSLGSTAQNLGYHGSIIYTNFAALQITPIAPINSKIYSSLVNSVIIPSGKVIKLIPENKKVRITVDGVHHIYNNVEYISSTIGDKKVKCLRFSHYNFPQKINEKLLSKLI